MWRDSGDPPPNRVLNTLSAGTHFWRMFISGRYARMPTTALAVGALAVGCLLLLILLRSASRAEPYRDPQRQFTAAQRRQAFTRAQNRCEMHVWIFFRCRRPAQHADHWVPWSRGGASSMSNLVAACATCNLRKSNKIPGAIATLMLEHRRRSYIGDLRQARAGAHHLPVPRERT